MPLVANGHVPSMSEEREVQRFTAVQSVLALGSEWQIVGHYRGGLSSQDAFLPQPARPFFPQPAPAMQVAPARQGLIDAFVNTCQRWRLNESSQLILLGYSGNETLGLEILHGNYLRPPQDARDRAGYVLGISLGLGAIFNEVLEAELAWLNTPHPALASRTPLSFMLLGKMANVMSVAALVAKERGLA